MKELSATETLLLILLSHVIADSYTTKIYLAAMFKDRPEVVQSIDELSLDVFRDYMQMILQGFQNVEPSTNVDSLRKFFEGFSSQQMLFFGANVDELIKDIFSRKPPEEPK